jgi:hypothetical protein
MPQEMEGKTEEMATDLHAGLHTEAELHANRVYLSLCLVPYVESMPTCQIYNTEMLFPTLSLIAYLAMW